MPDPSRLQPVPSDPRSQAQPLGRSFLLPIDLTSALRSIIRAWLAIRDQALLVFVSGTNPDNRLETPETAKCDDSLHRMRQLRETALMFAAQAAGKGETATDVLNREIDTVLETERPVFLLRTDSLPGSF